MTPDPSWAQGVHEWVEENLLPLGVSSPTILLRMANELGIGFALEHDGVHVDPQIVISTAIRLHVSPTGRQFLEERAHGNDVQITDFDTTFGSWCIQDGDLALAIAAAVAGVKEMELSDEANDGERFAKALREFRGLESDQGA